MESNKKTGSARIWLAIFVAALALRAGVALVRPPADDGDQEVYRSLAVSLHHGEGYSLEGRPETTFQPLLPVLHATVLTVVPDARIAGLLLTLIIGALVPVAGGRLVEGGFGRDAGIAAAALLAIQPHHVIASARLEPDLLAALLAFWLASLASAGEAVAAGIVAGLACLNRPEMLILTPVAAVMARARGVRWLRVACLVLLACGLTSLFVLFVYGATGRWALSGKDRWQYFLGVQQYRTGNQPIPREELPSLERDVGTPLEHIAGNPGEFARGYLYRSGLVLLNLGRQIGFLLPFLGWGAFRAWRTSRAALARVLLPLAPLPALPLVGTFFRHTVPAGAALVALSGVGIAALWPALREGIRGRTP
jgi:hypothetical protein